jgi:integrase
MARPKAKESRVYGLTDLRTRPSTAKHKARKDEAKRKVWLVRWTVDRRDHQKAFRYQKDAQTFMDELEKAMARQESFSLTTGLPASWEQPNPKYCDWARQYVQENLPVWAKKTTVANVESISRGVVLLRSNGAPEVDDEGRREIRQWLIGNVEDCPTTIARWSLTLEECNRNVCATARNKIQLAYDGTALKGNVAIRHRTQVNATFAEAVDRGLIETNPWVVKRRSAKRARKVVASTLSDDDIPSVAGAQSIIDSIEDDDYRILLTIILHAGLRPSEARGLRVDDLELPDQGWGNASIRRSLSNGAEGATDEADPVKTGNRRVPLSPFLVDKIRTHLDGRDSRLVATALRGGPVPEGDLQGSWRSVCTNERWKPYSLRHTAATTWIKAGVNPTEVARRLGNNPETLFKVYVNFINGDDLLANELIEKETNRAMAG